MKKLRLYARLLRLLAVISLGTLLAAGVTLLERLVRHDLMPTRQRLTRWFLARLAERCRFA